MRNNAWNILKFNGEVLPSTKEEYLARVVARKRWQTVTAITIYKTKYNDWHYDMIGVPIMEVKRERNLSLSLINYREAILSEFLRFRHGVQVM